MLAQLQHMLDSQAHAVELLGSLHHGDGGHTVQVVVNELSNFGLLLPTFFWHDESDKPGQRPDKGEQDCTDGDIEDRVRVGDLAREI